MAEETSSPRASALMARSLRDVWRAPFATLLAVALFLNVVSGSVAERADALSAWLTIAAIAASSYIQIAVTLAAGAERPERSADAWFRAAVRRRCFWRFLLTELIMVLLVALGLLLAFVGAFFVGALVALAQSAAALERRRPLDAVKRSLELGRGARRSLGVVFGALILLPAVVLQAGYQFGFLERFGVPIVALSVAAGFLVFVGTMALARAFVALGGATEPSAGEMAGRARR